MTERRTSRLGRAGRLAPLAIILFAVGVDHNGGAPAPATAAAPALPAPPANGEMGFALVTFHVPFHKTSLAQDCPDGMMGVLRDNYLATLPKAESTRLMLKENENEREAGWKAYGRGPNGANICSNIYEFMDRPPTPMFKGNVAWGLNLDDDDSGAGKDNYTCQHTDFTSPAGEKGIDNQAWRVMGCSQLYRGPADDGNGDHRSGQDGSMKTGEWTQVVLLRGVNSLINDKDVEVIYANTDDRPIADSSGRFIRNASFTVSSGGRKDQYRNVLHGHITNGVLTTDSKDILLNEDGGGFHTQFNLARGRLRLEFQPDGSAKGMVGGYQPLLNVLSAARGGGLATVNNAGLNCAGQYTALRMMADGDKDPKTGKCRKISWNYEFDGVPAFVNDVASKALASR